MGWSAGPPLLDPSLELSSDPSVELEELLEVSPVLEPDELEPDVVPSTLPELSPPEEELSSSLVCSEGRSLATASPLLELSSLELVDSEPVDSE